MKWKLTGTSWNDGGWLDANEHQQAFLAQTLIQHVAAGSSQTRWTI